MQEVTLGERYPTKKGAGKRVPAPDIPSLWDYGVCTILCPYGAWSLFLAELHVGHVAVEVGGDVVDAGREVVGREADGLSGLDAV